MSGPRETAGPAHLTAQCVAAPDALLTATEIGDAPHILSREETAIRLVERTGQDIPADNHARDIGETPAPLIEALLRLAISADRNLRQHTAERREERRRAGQARDPARDKQAGTAEPDA